MESLEEIEKIIPLEKICLENLEHSDFEMMADMVTKKKKSGDREYRHENGEQNLRL